eukprot:m.171966 g.171966  ORF g.171966 m.171966 type:complete len:179 (-) comp15360_c0_seq5:862-1398(-)
MASSGTTAEFNPPINFSMVAPGVYRSGFPEGDNFSFLEKKLKLKSVLLLVPESIPDKLLAFYKQAGVKVFQIGVPGNKEPFVDIPSDKIADALSVILNKNTHPILLHCNKGKHRTGCLVGCLRKLQVFLRLLTWIKLFVIIPTRTGAILLYVMNTVGLLPPRPVHWTNNSLSCLIFRY